MMMMMMMMMMMKGVGIWQSGQPWSVCPGRKDGQRLGQRQIDDHHLKDNRQPPADYAQYPQE